MTVESSPTDPPRARPRLGMMLGLGAAMASAAGLVPYKLATREAAVPHIVLLLMFSAASMNTLASLPALLSAARGSGQAGARVPGQVSLPVTLWAALLMGILAAGANYFASEAVARLDAAVAALLIQLQVVFAAVAAFVWLREKVSARFVAGAVLAALGVAFMHVRGSAPVAQQLGVVYGLAGAACFGSMQVVVRRYIHRIRPVWTNSLRLWVAVLIVASVPGAVAGALACSPRVMMLAATAALCGPFMGRLMLMFAARHLPAALSTLFGLCTPVLALGMDWAFLDSFPGPREWAGGAIVIAGMLLALAPHRGRAAAVAATS